MQRAIRIHEKDNVAVALTSLKKGETFTFGDVTVTLAEDIEQGHKFALRDIHTNENIVKYGTLIGHVNALGKDGIIIVNTLDLGGKQFTLGEEIDFTFPGSVANIFDKDGVNLEFGPHKVEEAEAPKAE